MNDSTVDRLRLPDRTRRHEDGPAATHLPGHTLFATERWTVLAEAPRETRPGYAEDPRVVYAPQAFLLFGRDLYAGVGLGTTYSERRLTTSPFVGLRTGLSIDLPGRWQLDISAYIQIRDSSRDPRAILEDPTAEQIQIAGMLRWPF
jgi:hypothetical protein